MTAPTLDALAAKAGGYVAAAALEQDIADQFDGLGDAETDALATRHRTIARALIERANAITHRER